MERKHDYNLSSSNRGSKIRRTSRFTNDRRVLNISEDIEVTIYPRYNTRQEPQKITFVPSKGYTKGEINER